MVCFCVKLNDVYVSNLFWRERLERRSGKDDWRKGEQDKIEKKDLDESSCFIFLLLGSDLELGGGGFVPPISIAVGCWLFLFVSLSFSVLSLSSFLFVLCLYLSLFCDYPLPLPQKHAKKMGNYLWGLVLRWCVGGEGLNEKPSKTEPSTSQIKKRKDTTSPWYWVRRNCAIFAIAIANFHSRPEIAATSGTLL